MTVEQIYQQLKEQKIGIKKLLYIHFKCSNCNDMIDIDGKDITLDYIKCNQKVEHNFNVTVNDANMVLLGLCYKCKEDFNAKTYKIQKS